MEYKINMGEQIDSTSLVIKKIKHEYIKSYSESIEKYNNHGDEYWKGVSDSLQRALNDFFPSWASPNTIGYYIFNEQMTYEEAIKKLALKKQR
jgi:hypothetical protein